MNCGTVNMPAQNRIHLELLRVTHNRFLEFTNEIDGIFDSLFGVGAEGPITQTESTAEKIDRRIEREKKFVADVAEISQPLGILHDGVELVPVNDQNAAIIGGNVNRALLDRYVPVGTGERRNEFVVITRDINDGHVFARLAEDFLDDVVMRLWPVMPSPQRPDINQITDDIEFFAFVIAQELQERFGVARSFPEVNI